MSGSHQRAPWRFHLQTTPEQARQRLEEVAGSAQYGWGQSVDLGDGVRQEGFLGSKWHNVIDTLDRWGWLDADLTGQRVADIGCFSGAMSVVLADRGASVLAIDEVPEHLEQATTLVELLGVPQVETIASSLYGLRDRIEPGSLDLVVLSGVLYHLSDMLAGLIAVQQLLKPGGRMLIQSNAIENYEASYANFGRFYAGWWWQPTALCLQDMSEFAGFEPPQVRFYEPGRCLAVAHKPNDAIDPEAAVPYKRGVHWPFQDLSDSTERHLDASALAPAPDPKGDTALARRWGAEAVGRAARIVLNVAARAKGWLTRARR